MLFELIGGIGLFLMGMVLLSEGLKTFAGDRLRQALVRFTGRPFKAFASGALVTAVVQSSSATTVTVIGLVSAGLLAFPQAVGVVIGASLGTTATGWIVSTLGLKVSVGLYALPLVGIGVFVRLLGAARFRPLGVALAGFGLIFLGISTLQEGMLEFAQVFTLSRLPSGGLVAHLLGMLIGAGMTVVMQSSSAAMATTLTALHTDSVNFDQAASLVIGAAVGTTVTGALAAIGASVPAKRTALAHVVFNLATGLIAVLTLPLFMRGINAAQLHLGLEPGATSLALFHTVFIAAGVVIFLPFVNRFSAAIERVLPESEPTLTRHLDDTVLNVPAVALEATRRALSETAREMFIAVGQRLAGTYPASNEAHVARIQQALDRTQRFFARIPPLAEDQPMTQSRVAQMHAIDHLLRLKSCLEPPPSIIAVMARDQLQPELAQSEAILDLAAAGLGGSASDDWLKQVEQKSLQLAQRRREDRPAVLRQTAYGGLDPALALNVLDAMRWLDRVGYHVWRICTHLGGETRPAPSEPDGELPLSD